MNKSPISLLLTTVFSLVCLVADAQNLVPNPGFESNIGVPAAAGQWNLAQPWLGLNASADLYGRNFSGAPAVPCDAVGVPLNVGGFCQERTNFNHYMGLQIDFQNNYREYLSAPLAIPMAAGNIYSVEFYVQRADSCRFAINSFGALFTNNIPAQAGTGVINFPAQIEESAIISDTAVWTPVRGIYQALGGENYITVGVFRADNDPSFNFSDWGARATGCSSMDNSAYYFLDDVSVKKIDLSIEILGDSVLCPNESTTLTANCNVPFWWSLATSPAQVYSTDTSITISPTGAVTFILNTDFGIDSMRLQIVNPPVFSLGADTLLCEGDTLLLDATVQDAVSYAWSTGDTTSVLAVVDTGRYFVTVDNTGCSRSDSIYIPDFLSNPPVPIGEDSLYCFFYNDSLKLNAGPGLSYLWLPTFETSQEITVLTPGTYTVDVVRANGCRKSAFVNAAEICEPLLFVPSAFSPDDDGINDLFIPFVSNVVKYSVRVINRRGQLVFYSETPGDGWDGTFEGEDAPIGVYVYRVNFEGLDSEGIKVKKKVLGTVNLLR